MTATMQTRSKTCRRRANGACGRLTGHKGACRPTLTANGSPFVTVETLTADRYEVPAEPPKATVVLDHMQEVAGRTWHIVLYEDGTVTSTEVVPAKAPAKARKARRPKVRNLRHVAPKERVGVTGPVGQPKPAKRAKAAPHGTKSRSNANALKGRLAPKAVA